MQIRLMWALAVAAAVVTAACGDSKSTLNPNAPSALSAEEVSAATADGISGTMHHKPGHGGGPGNGNGNGNGNGRGPRQPSNTSPDPTAPLPPGKSKVEFEGLIQAVSSGSILVTGQMIIVTDDTVIRHGNTTFELTELNQGDRVHVRANRVAATGGSAATLEAAVILLQNPGGEGEGEEGEGGGETDGLVSVTASDPTATESPVTSGTFTLTRAASAAQLSLPLTVSYALTGTATNGADYADPLTAVFAAGETTTTVEITPSIDAVAEGPETVILTLTGVAPYELGSPTTATLTITDAVPEVSVTVTDATVSETGPDTGEFTLTRTGDLSAPLEVTVAFMGTATNGTDYELLPATVSFAAGSATATVVVTPVADAVLDAGETVLLIVLDDEAYNPGATPTAQLTIAGL